MHPCEPSDHELLAATARGDAEAFGHFYRRHQQRVLAYAIGRCPNAADVADLVGETFLGALSSAGRFTGRGTEEGDDAIAWLYGIARRVLSRQRRSFSRRLRLVQRLESLPQLGADEAAAVEAAIDAARLLPQVAAALSTLPAKDQELLRLVGADELTPSQAGAVLGLNPNTARLRLSRARARLRATLDSPNRPDADSTSEVRHAQS
jgi:RNA polymerase sigma-70 factor (ECF subfamily)